MDADEDGWRERLKAAIEYSYFEREMPDKLPFLEGLMAAVLTLRNPFGPYGMELFTFVKFKPDC